MHITRLHKRFMPSTMEPTHPHSQPFLSRLSLRILTLRTCRLRYWRRLKQPRWPKHKHSLPCRVYGVAHPLDPYPVSTLVHHLSCPVEDRVALDRTTSVADRRCHATRSLKGSHQLMPLQRYRSSCQASQRRRIFASTALTAPSHLVLSLIRVRQRQRRVDSFCQAKLATSS